MQRDLLDELITDPDDLESVPVELHEFYTIDDAGKPRLRPEIEAELERLAPEYAALLTRHKEELEARDDKIARLDGKILDLVSRRAIRSSLAAADVSPKMMRAAEAALLEELHIEIERDDDGGFRAWASGAYGRCSVESAVAHWLAGPEGSAFGPAMPTTGPFTTALKRVLH